MRKEGYGRLQRILGMDFPMDAVGDLRRVSVIMGDHILSTLKDSRRGANFSDNHCFRTTRAPGFQENDFSLFQVSGSVGSTTGSGAAFGGSASTPSAQRVRTAWWRWCKLAAIPSSGPRQRARDW